LPFSKVPFLRFIRATYSYTGDFQWQKGSDLFKNIEIELSNGTVGVYDLGNTVQNSNSHRINSNIDFNSFYRYIGLTKIQPSSTATDSRDNTPNSDVFGGDDNKSGGTKGNDSGRGNDGNG